MIYKRATQQLRAAGIEHIVVKNGLWGASLHDPRLMRQTSTVYPTAQAAVDAAIAGARPEPLEEQRE